MAKSNPPVTDGHDADLKKIQELGQLSEKGNKEASKMNWTHQYSCSCRFIHPVADDDIDYNYGYNSETLEFERLSSTAGRSPIFQKDLHPYEFGKL